jgi:hypothetical protein
VILARKVLKGLKAFKDLKDPKAIVVLRVHKELVTQRRTSPWFRVSM